MNREAKQQLRGMYVNPLLFKYYWWVVPASNLPDLTTFRPLLRGAMSRESYIKKTYKRMCTFDAMMYIQELEERNRPYFVSWEKLPRMGAGSPFDLTKEKWKEQKFAPSFYEDTDPIWDEYR